MVVVVQLVTGIASISEVKVSRDSFTVQISQRKQNTFHDQ